MFKALKPTLAASIVATTLSFGSYAADLEKIHFLIPWGCWRRLGYDSTRNR